MRFIQVSLVTACSVLALTASGASAQTATAPASTIADQAQPAEPPAATGLADIIVTAERRSSSIQKTAAIITAVTGDELERRGITSVRNLTTTVPGLSVASTSANSHISLFGIVAGSSSGYVDPTVAFNVDGVPIARQFATTAAFYDLERVEILKGPQGTLYGRNATVGALNLITAQPKLDRTTLSAGADFGNYNQLNTQLAVNLPVSDTVAIRAAGATNYHKGYLTNGYNDANNRSGRVAVLFKPSSTFRTTFGVDYYNDDSHGPSVVYLYPNGFSGSQFANPSNPWQGFQPVGCGNVALCPAYGNGAVTVNPAFASQSVVGNDGYQKVTQIIVRNETVADLGPVSLTFIPAYVHTKAAFVNYSQGFRSALSSTADQESVELRVASNTSSARFKWLIGGFYYHEVPATYVPTLEPNGYAIQDIHLTDTSLAAFGEASFAFRPWLRLTGGLRYTSEKKTQDSTSSVDGIYTTTTCPAPAAITLANALQPTGACTFSATGDLRFSNVSFKVGLEADVGRRSLAYATVKTGFKAGGFFLSQAPNTYKPEKLTDYEIGIKNRFLNDRLQVNLSAFYWDYKDQQISANTQLVPAGSGARPFNVPGWLEGVEGNIAVRPTSNDELTADIVYAKGKYTIYPGTGSSYTGIVPAYTDRDRLNLPHWTGTVTYDHTFHLTKGDRIVASAKLHAESGTWLNIAQSAGTYRNGYAIGNLELGYTSPNGIWSITGYVDNVTNHAVVLAGPTGNIALGILYRPTTNPGALVAALAPPRTFGVRLKVNLEK